MNRPLKLSMLVALALASTQVLALDLGQVQVKSTLNSPLVAEIPLTLDYAGEASQLHVSLATAEDFARAGISRTDLKVPLKFNVVTNAQGQKVLRITSSEPVNQPYLDFLIQVNWPKGHMLREYTVLLDPPNMPAAAPPTTAPRSTPIQNTPPRPVATSSPPAPQASAAPTAVGRIHDGHYGPVRAGETLSQIANATRMSGVTYDQMMLALKGANPDAFYRDNINALKRGAVLRIPTRAEAQAQKAAAAHAAARQQNQAWLSGAASTPTMVAGAGGATAGTSAASADHASDRLALVPPDAGDKSTADGSNAAAKALQQNLAQTKETLSNQKQQNAELQTRVKDLEQLKSKNQRLVSMKDAQIASLQQQLAKAHQQAGETGATAPAAAAMAGDHAVPVKAAPSTPALAASSAATVAATSAASVVKPAATPAQAKPVAAAKVAASKPVAPKPSSMNTTPKHASASAPATIQTPWYRQTWVWLVGAAIIVVLILLGLFGRRRAEPEGAGRASLADQFGASPFGSEGTDEGDATDHDEGDATEHDDVDANAEMDADQRELLQQLAENPDDIGLHLELVSLYYARRDVDGFEGAAEAMYAYVSDPQQPEWLDVVAMGEELAPSHPLFGDHEHSTLLTDDTHTPEAPQEFDVDADSAHDESSVQPESPGDSSYSHDFDLTPGAGNEHHLQADADEIDVDAPTQTAGMDEFADDTTDQPAEEPLTTSSSADDDDAQLDEPLGNMYSDDPVDTKLDLARAYMDMGDHDGARSMLEEVRNEGSQVQQDVACKLLEELS